MPFQKQVDLYIPEGLPGDLATPDQAIYTVINYLAETPITVGNFAFLSTTNPDSMATQSGTGRPLGLVKRDLSFVNYDLLSPGTLIVPALSTLSIVVKGDMFVASKTNAAIGDAVYADQTTGEISTAASGRTIAGSIETNWRVKTAGAAGDIIIISNWD